MATNALADVHFETISYLDFEGNLSNRCHHRISHKDLVEGYQTMLITRHVDERMITLQRQGTITFALASRGEEGCIVASAMALDIEDWLYPQYRECGIMFARGYSIQDYIHHMFCNAKDSIHGRQMPNHFGSRELNVVTVSSPIGTKIPHAAGCAYGMKLKKDPHVALVYFGEGATSEGDFHAGLNFAAVRKAPAIFFCRNNQYAISTRTHDQFATEGVAAKGLSYGVKTYRVDGNDFFAVHEVVTEARTWCMEGKGPVFIEAMTYRMGAHSTSDDPTAYRSREEEQKWEKKDPILRLRKYLEKQGFWDEKREKEFIEKIKKEVTEAINSAKQEPRPPLKSLFKDVYFSMPENLKEQQEECQRIFPEE